VRARLELVTAGFARYGLLRGLLGAGLFGCGLLSVELCCEL